MQFPTFIITGCAALIFAGVFLMGRRLYPLRLLRVDERSLVSFSGGFTLAYVFVRVMPELGEARGTLISTTSLPVFYEGMAIYVMALIGFLVFFNLDRLSRKARAAAEEQDAPEPGYDLKIAGFAGYVALASYILAHSAGGSVTSIALFTVAMALHFLTCDHAFRSEGGQYYRRRGHLILAAAAVAGWCFGQATSAPDDVVAVMLGFLSGGIIVNSAISELPNEREGRLLPFTLGALIYSLILVPLGAQ